MTVKLALGFNHFPSGLNKATFKDLLSRELKLHRSRHSKINFVYHREEVNKLNTLCSKG